MKKFIAGTAAIAMMPMLAACTNNSESTFVSANASEIADTATVVTETNEEAVDQMDDEAVDSTTVVSEVINNGEMAEILAEKNGEMWMANLSEKMENADTNVEITASYSYYDEDSGEDLETKMYMNVLSDNVYMSFDLLGINFITCIFTNDSVYYLDEANKSYYVSDSESDTEFETYVIDSIADCYQYDGLTTIDGELYIFEHYASDDNVIEYYFDKNGNVKKICTFENDEAVYMDYVIDILDTADESVFDIPADYTEGELADYFSFSNDIANLPGEDSDANE